MAVNEKLVTRDKKVAFMAVGGKDETIFTRMTKFTSMSKSSNPVEYSRTYVDEAAERSDVTGYAPSIAYGFDQYENNEVHNDIISITEGEKVGDDAIRTILIVDFTAPVTASDTTKYKAVKRNYSVIPDSDGGDENAYTYSGNFKASGAKEEVTVTSTDEWKTCTISK